MKRISTKAIVLRRTNYGEADRIINVFTSDHGKVSAMARGVRKPKSKLAGGIELLSVGSIGLYQGKGSLYTLTSSRMDEHFGEIIKDYDIMQYAYTALKLTDKLTDDEAGPEYFVLLRDALKMFDENPKKKEIVFCWFLLQIMKLNGSLPGLVSEVEGADLRADGRYRFSVEDGGFFASNSGEYQANEIKAWRVFAQASASQLINISGLGAPARLSVDALEEFALYQT